MRRFYRHLVERDAPRSSLTRRLSPLEEYHSVFTGRRPEYDPSMRGHKLDLDIERRKVVSPEPIRRSRQELFIPRRVQEKPKPSQADRRFYRPDHAYVASKYGYAARVEVGDRKAAKHIFAHPELSYPCIQRSIRREVMFANKSAGKGYRRKKRWTHISEIEC